MDADLFDCETDESLLLAVRVSDPPAATSPERSGAFWYPLERFAGEVGAELACHDIGVRLSESLDGTRFITAWRFGLPKHIHVIAVDSVPVCPDEVPKLARAIKRNLDLAITD